MRSMMTECTRRRQSSQDETPDPRDPRPAGSKLTPDERDLVAALAVGDEGAFARLVHQYNRPLLRQALVYVSNEAVAEEVVQETWLAVMESIKRFEGRSSLKTWLYQIVIHKAKSAGVKESRQLPFSSIGPQQEDADDSDLESKLTDVRENGRDGQPWLGSAADAPTPEESLVAEECRREITQAIRALPTTQRRVLELYHFDGMSSEEVCRRLRITETNKHVLLHRGRNQVRKAVDRYFSGDRRRTSTVRQVYQLGLAA